MADPQCLALRDADDGMTVAYFVGLHARDDEIRRLRAALERIASTSPRAWRRPGCAEDERCIHCHALIDEARDAIGWARWPAPTGTPA